MKHIFFSIEWSKIHEITSKWKWKYWQFTNNGPQEKWFHSILHVVLSIISDWAAELAVPWLSIIGPCSWPQLHSQSSPGGIRYLGAEDRIWIQRQILSPSSLHTRLIPLQHCHRLLPKVSKKHHIKCWMLGYEVPNCFSEIITCRNAHTLYMIIDVWFNFEFYNVFWIPENLTLRNRSIWQP